MPTLSSNKTRARKGTNYILAIAIDEYKKDDFLQLDNAKNDAEAFIKILTTKYRFEDNEIQTKRLYDAKATRGEILRTFRSYNRLNENDSLILFYSGHAHKIEETEEGYIIPVDVKKNNIDANRIMYSEITQILKKIITPKHIILFLNCCYAGNFFTKTRSIIPTYKDKRFLQKSRWAFAAGEKDQEVLDESNNDSNKSPFVEYIVKFLEHNYNDSISITELISNVTDRVADNYISQIPLGRSIQDAGDEGGEFSFQLKDNEEDVWKAAFEKDTVESLSEAIKRFPESQLNRLKAEKRLELLLKERGEWIEFLKIAKCKLSNIVSNHGKTSSYYDLAKKNLNLYNDNYKKLTYKERAQTKWKDIQDSVRVEDKISHCKEFIYEFKKSEYYPYVKQLKIRLENEEGRRKAWIDCQNEAKKIHTPKKRLHVFKAFLLDYSAGYETKAAEIAVEDIMFCIQAFEEYNKTRNYTLLQKYKDKYGNKAQHYRIVNAKLTQIDNERKLESEKEKFVSIADSKSVTKLLNFINDEETSSELRKEAIDFLESLKIEIQHKFSKAVNQEGVKMIYDFINTYPDCSEVVEAKKLFEERQEQALKNAIIEVRNSKKLDALENHISEFETYKGFDVKLARRKKDDFQKDILAYAKAMETKDFKSYIENNEYGLFVEDAKREIDKIENSTQEAILRKKCFEHHKLSDLKRYVRQFKETEYYDEINALLIKEETTINAKALFTQIKELMVKDERDFALDKISMYERHFPEEEDYPKLAKFEAQIELYNREDEAFEDILKHPNDEDRCYSFLATSEFQRKDQDVKNILNKIMKHNSSSLNNTVENANQKQNKFFGDVKITDILIVLLLIILIALFLFK